MASAFRSRPPPPPCLLLASTKLNSLPVRLPPRSSLKLKRIGWNRRRRRGGKVSLLVLLTDQRFLANSDLTLGVEFGSKLITLPDAEGTVVKLQYWDTAGTASVRSITRSYDLGVPGASSLLLVSSSLSICKLVRMAHDVMHTASSSAKSLRATPSTTPATGSPTCPPTRTRA
ncbi:hypothetical protein DFH09DRAFT_1360139 [Mycena vulgaris]|nr:hypothetical protein DFH09DRAFT_1360139 [Mycena vulgaris]